MRRLRRLLLAVCGIYVGICGFLLIAQNRLLYIGTVLPPHPPSVTFASFNAANGTQIGWLAAPAGPPRGTIVFFHGNDQEAWQAERDYAGYFTARGWRVVFPEYRGFDFRSSEAPAHDSVIAEAVADVKLAELRYPGPIWVAGNSLGAGIAAQAAQPGGVQRVLLFVPWDSMSAVAQERYPLIPTQALLWADGTDYNSCTALAGWGRKTFITYAGQDVIIPAHHAQHLAQCLDVPDPQIFPLPAATHLDWYEHLTPQQWDRMLGAAP